MFKVPNLNFEAALSFCAEINSYEPISENEIFEFDFSNVKNCDPFPMLMVSNAIRHKREKYQNHQFIAINFKNDYARYMKFYNACGIDSGDSVECYRGNSKYICITKLNVADLFLESQENFDYIQETLEKEAKDIALVLSHNNIEFQKWMIFVIRELLRNIPEHSKSKTIWYCAQYWPSYDLVELAILDEGIGISNSLNDSYEFRSMYNNDYEALQLALEPGVSGTFSSSRKSIGSGDWKNSGFGLYMVSQMCAELGASFIIASGNSAIRMKKENGSIMSTRYDTFISGTAVQIRIRPSMNCNYDQIRSEIVKRGENIAKNKDYTIHSASKSSKGLIF